MRAFPVFGGGWEGVVVAQKLKLGQPRRGTR